MYMCERCCIKYRHPNSVRMIQGNITIPDRGGLVGNNIFTGSIEKSERKRKHKVGRSKDNTVRIYGSLLCTNCLIEIISTP